MYKVLIIDDEKPVRQAISLLGNWSKFNIETLYEAMEGQSGLNILREQQPHIVFVDMKMPGMNGVEFLKIAKQEFPDVKYIVASGYDDFEYTKQAIKSKVMDYLLKPIIEDELNNVLEKAVAELEEERKKREENKLKHIEENITAPFIKEKIIRSIIEEDVSSAIIGGYKKFFYDEKRSNIKHGIAILNVINFNEVCQNRFKDDVTAAFYAFINIIDEMCVDSGNSFSFKAGKANQDIVIVLSAAVCSEMEAVNTACCKLKEVIEKLKDLFGVYSVASIGRFYSEFEKLNESYNHALVVLNKINLLDNREYIFTDVDTIYKSNRVSLNDRKEILIKAFETGSIEYAKKIISEYLMGIRNMKWFTMEDFYKTAMEFVLIISDIAERFNIPIEKGVIPSFRNGEVNLSFSNVDDLTEFSYDLLEKVYTVIKQNLQASEKKNIYSIRDYIDSNYFREIKLGMFSEKYYLSKEYLSKLFKEEFGYSIYEYVLRVRMEKAKEMLRDPKIKIQSISESLGYKDNNYFSKAFKNFYGISPSEIREKKIKVNPVSKSQKLYK